jgi:hypothetical protein
VTEQEWLRENDPHPILEFVRDTARERKLRLFACACCRRVWDLLKDSRSREAVELAEMYADGQIQQHRMKAAEQAAKAAEEAERSKAAEAASLVTTTELWAYHAFPLPSVRQQLESADRVWVDYARVVATLAASAFGPDREPAEREAQCSILHDLFGNPFRSVALDPPWLTWQDATIPRLARTIYDERAFDRMPILGDALEEAGCDNADILDHCRHSGVHVRGCWLVDSILGKT